MHSGKLNLTQLNSTGSFSSVQFSWVEFSSVFCCALSPVVAARRRFSSNDRHCTDWPIHESMSRLWRTCDDRQFRRRIAEDRRRSWPVQCTAGNWTELNSWVEFSSVFCCALGRRVDHLERRGNYSATLNNVKWSWYTGRWRVGCYIWYSEEGTKKFFRLWSVTVELIAALCSWPISDNDAVLHTSEDFSISQSILYLA